MGKFLDWLGNAWNTISGEKQRQEYNAAEAEKQRQFNAAEAEKQRQYETEMSNTAFQRQTEDLKKAGLNSALAYSGGASGASTPSGAMASGSSASSSASASSPLSIFPNIINSVANAVNVINNDRNRRNDIDLRRMESTAKNLYRFANKTTRTYHSDGGVSTTKSSVDI